MIQLYLQSLSKILNASVQDFSCRRDYIQYKKQMLHRYRNQIIGNFLDVPVQQLSFSKYENGKPFLLNYNHLHFNQSHSQDDYLLALSSTIYDIGVDVESISRKVNFDALAKHAFHRQEYNCWKELDEDPTFWFKIWTAKEAVLKAHGLGIRLQLRSINTQFDPTHHVGRLIDERLGDFSYQGFKKGHRIFTVAWRTTTDSHLLTLPRIQLISD